MQPNSIGLQTVTKPFPLSKIRSMVVVSDRVEQGSPRWNEPNGPQILNRWTGEPSEQHPWPSLEDDPVPAVTGGYLERLPLALVAAGLVDQAEIWHHWLGEGQAPFRRAMPRLAYRAFHLDTPQAPFGSADMKAFLCTFGAPHILVVLGLGISEDILDACEASVVIYNSIDSLSLRVPARVSSRFDIVITGAEWQSEEVEARHPGMATMVLPIGPEFAAIDLFRPLGIQKDYDLVYVAAAQAYKRHDILLNALAGLPRDIRALCVFGYGEMADALRGEASKLGLSVDFIGPPGVSFEEVNRLMNRAKFGVVCGRNDGAPAILTEYMLAGLPVLANAELSCGRQFILPETGRCAAAGDFASAIMAMRDGYEGFKPREAVLARWTWPHSVERLRPLVQDARFRKSSRAGYF